LAALIIVALLVGLVSSPDDSGRAAELAAQIGRLKSNNEQLLRENERLASENRRYASRQGSRLHRPEEPGIRRIEIRLPGSGGPGAPVGRKATGSRGPRYKTYVVKRNDSLWTIAKQFYGDASKYKLIEKANNLRENQTLPIGMKLRIPIKSSD